MEFYENLFKKIEDNNIDWFVRNCFLEPEDFEYTDKEKNQINFIVDVVCGIMKNSKVEINVTLSPNFTAVEIEAEANDPDINGWDKKSMVWSYPSNDRKLKEHIEKDGYYWGTVRCMLNNEAIPFYTLMSYFQESFMKAKNGDTFEYYVGGEKKLYYIRKIVLSELQEEFYIYDKPLNEVKFDDPYLYSLRYSTIDSTDLYPSNL